MPRNRSAAVSSRITANIAAGVAGGLIASYVMEKAQSVIERLAHGNEGASGGGGQQHRRQHEGEPATYKAADAIAESVVDRPVPRQYKPAAGAAIHYAFGGVVGALYGALAATKRDVTVAAGIPFGAAVWLVADEIGVPAAGLAKRPTEYPMSKHASALAAHLVYGATTELVRRGLMAAFTDGRPR